MIRSGFHTTTLLSRAWEVKPVIAGAGAGTGASRWWWWRDGSLPWMAHTWDGWYGVPHWRGVWATKRAWRVGRETIRDSARVPQNEFTSSISLDLLVVQLSSLMRKEAAGCEIVCECYRVVIAGLAGPRALLRDHIIPFNMTYTRIELWNYRIF